MRGAKIVVVAALAVILIGVPSLVQATCYRCAYIRGAGWRCAFAKPNESGKTLCSDSIGCRLLGNPCPSNRDGGVDPPKIEYQDFGAQPGCVLERGVPLPVRPLPLSEHGERR